MNYQIKTKIYNDFQITLKKNSQKILKSCFKFVFLTKKFKEKNQRYNSKTFSKCNDQKHHIHNICNIIEITKSMEPNKCIYNCFLQKCLFKCFINDLNFFDGPKGNQL